MCWKDKNLRQHPNKSSTVRYVFPIFIDLFQNLSLIDSVSSRIILATLLPRNCIAKN